MKRNRTIVVGCGKLGASIASRASETGKNVVVIDSDPASFDILAEDFSGFKITGDASSTRTLEEAEIGSAQEIVITTGNDNLNLYLSHVAVKVYEVPEVYVRFDETEKGALISGMNINAIYPFELSRNKFDKLEGEEEDDE